MTYRSSDELIGSVCICIVVLGEGRDGECHYGVLGQAMMQTWGEKWVDIQLKKVITLETFILISYLKRVVRKNVLKI